jgi:hypothetical protein
MPAYADYLDLRLAVSDRIGNRAITDVFPRLVQTAEAWMNRKIRTRNQIVSGAFLTFSNGSAALPTGYLEMIELLDPANCKLTGWVESGYPLAGYYAISDDAIIVKDANGTFKATYYIAIPTLTATVTTSNWLLAKYPDMYFHAVRREAADFVGSADQVADAEKNMARILGEIRLDDGVARYGDGTVTLKSVTP